MPLFFILAGMTFRIPEDKTYSQVIGKFARIYIIPYFVLTTINLLLQSLWLLYIKQYKFQQATKYLLGIVYCYANIDWMPNCSPLWFLPCIFIAKSIYYLVLKKIQNRLQPVCFILCGLISYALYVYEVTRLPWNFSTALMAIPLLWIGQLFVSKNILIIFKRKSIMYGYLVIMAALTPLLIKNGGSVGMNENCYGNLLLFFISGVGYSVLVMVLSQKLQNITYLCDFLGKNTVIVIGFNYFARHMATELYYMIPIVKYIQINAYSLFIGTFLLVNIAILSYIALRKKYLVVEKVKRLEP